MRGVLRPDFQFDSLEQITAEKLQQLGIRGLILDLDNTITPWNDRTLTNEVIEWFHQLKDAGIQSCIVSNNSRPERVAAVADVLAILYVHQAAKPRRKAFQMGLEALHMATSEVAVIGDQIFTDIFGGNRAGLTTILVSPIHPKEFPGTKILRLMERIAGRKLQYIKNDQS